MLKPTKITLETTEEVERLLRKLAENGLFGTTKGEVAEQLLREKLREVILQGWLGPPGMPGQSLPLVR